MHAVSGYVSVAVRPAVCFAFRPNRTLFLPLTLPSLSISLSLFLSATGSGINVSFDFGTLYLHLWQLNSRFKLHAHSTHAYRHIQTDTHIQTLTHTLEHTRISITQRVGSTSSSSSYEIFISQSAVRHLLANVSLRCSY